MFCPNCGSNQPDNAPFCGKCGASLNAAQAPAPEAAAPAPAAYAPKADKKTWFKEQASDKAKSMAKVSLIIAVVCALMISLITVSMLTGSVLDMPIVSFAEDMSGDDLDLDMDYLEDAIDEGRDSIDDLDIDKKAEKALDKVLDKMEKVADNFSISNVIGLANTFEDTVDKFSDELEDAGLIDDGDSFFDDEWDEIVGLLNTVMGVAIFFTVVGILLALLAGLLKNKVFAILGIIGVCLFALPTSALFGGIFFALLALACFIALVVVISKIDGEYKLYLHA